TLPVFAKQVLHGDAATFGFLTAAMGAGAVVGGLVTAGRGKTGMRPMVLTAGAFTLFVALAALAPNLTWELIALLLVGAASVSFLSIGNSTLQLAADPQMRGRVISLWAVAFLGSTPIGGPVIGAVCQHLGGRYGLGVGALACAVATVLGAVALRHLRPGRRLGRRPRETLATAEAQLEQAELS
ncbi:MAG TPA: MFS transporter, partial [Mycobacteriales bacterium]